MPYRASEIARYADFPYRNTWIKIYIGHGQYDRCERDLKALEHEEKVHSKVTKRGRVWAAGKREIAKG